VALERPDQPRLVVKENVVVRKFDGDICDDEHLAEVLVIEDGVLIDQWKKGDPRDAPA
jgi:hypothetical protein